MPAGPESAGLGEAPPDRMPLSNRMGPAPLAPEEPPAPQHEDFANPAQFSM
jgi:hypothetical protein